MKEHVQWSCLSLGGLDERTEGASKVTGITPHKVLWQAVICKSVMQTHSPETSRKQKVFSKK